MLSKILAGGQGKDVKAHTWRPSGYTPAFEEVSSRSEGGPASEDLKSLRRRLEERERDTARQVSEARAEGLRQGEALGRSAAKSEIDPVIERMTKAVHELADLRPRLRREAESDVVRLAVAIAKRILHRELCIDPAVMEALVQVALAQLDRQEIVSVRVHPGHVDAVRTRLAVLSSRDISVIPDVTRKPGCLIFETNRGKLDASIDTQLEEIERGLTDRVNHK